MERPLEWLALVCVVGIVGVLVLRSGAPSMRRQAIVGGAIGLVSAAVVLSAQGDLVPDGYEPMVAAAGLAALGTLAALSWLRRKRD